MNRPDKPVRSCSDDHNCSFILPHNLHLYIRYKNCFKIVDFRLYFEVENFWISKKKICSSKAAFEISCMLNFWATYALRGRRYWRKCRKKSNFCFNSRSTVDLTGLKYGHFSCWFQISWFFFNFFHFLEYISLLVRFEIISSISPPTQFVGGSKLQHRANFWCQIIWAYFSKFGNFNFLG